VRQLRRPVFDRRLVHILVFAREERTIAVLAPVKDVPPGTHVEAVTIGLTDPCASRPTKARVG
jgi:hypothetical protein